MNTSTSPLAALQDPTLLKTQALIDGQWVDAADDAQRFDVTDPATGATLASVNPGDEVILFEPFYDSYPACAAMAGATVRYVPLRWPDMTFDVATLSVALRTIRTLVR